MISDWLVSIEGTETGQQLALWLALLAAVLHAFFGALQKGKTDPWTTRTVIDGTYALIAVPLLFLVPFCLFLLYIGWDYVAVSWEVRERSGEPGGLPLVWLLKTLVLVLPVLLLLQAGVNLRRCLQGLRAGRTADLGG